MSDRARARTEPLTQPGEYTVNNKTGEIVGRPSGPTMTSTDDALSGFLAEFLPSTTLNPGESRRIIRSFLEYLTAEGWTPPPAPPEPAPHPLTDHELNQARRHPGLGIRNHRDRTEIRDQRQARR